MPIDTSENPVATSSVAPTANFRTTALIVAAALLMEQIDVTVLATALPTMARDFGVSAVNMSVAMTSYLLSLAIFIPASGKVADRFGARNVFCAAIVLFTLGSVLCGQSGSLPFLVAARLVQGLGGAMMVPVGRLVILRTVTKAELVNAMSWVLVPGLIGPVIGPPLGGFIVTYFSWPWIFYINVPIGIAGLALAIRFIPDFREASSSRFDFPGLILSGTALSCLIFGCEFASHGVTSLTLTLVLFGIGIVAGALYILYARRVSEPILDISLMRIPTFNLAVIGGSLWRIAGGSLPFLMPLMMQLGFGKSAVASGAITFMSSAGSMVMKASAPRVLRRFGFRNTMIWNAAIATALLASCAAFRPSWPEWAIYGVLLVTGFFQSLQFTAYNTIAFAEIPPNRSSAAMSFYSTFQQLMLSLGICVAATVLNASIAVSGHAHATLGDFTVAFLTVTAISIWTAPLSARFNPRAGEEMSGYRGRQSKSEPV
ncbi:MAG TPA: MFS transporter [Stellaceae bacterium]|nr:MFS transporter [Stellaceae bacterium]